MEKETVSYLAFEGTCTRFERTNRRQFIAILVLIFALIATNAGWLYYESQFVDTEITQEIDAVSDGNSDLNLQTIGGDYDVSESESKTNN